jgi:hypothetical protein
MVHIKHIDTVLEHSKIALYELINDWMAAMANSAKQMATIQSATQS